MARFRRRKFSRKPDSSTNETKNLEKEEIRSEITEDGQSFSSKETKTVITDETNSTHTTSSLKSWTISGTKYIYIIAAAALASGIFTPLVSDGIDLEIVIVRDFFNFIFVWLSKLSSESLLFL